MMEADVKVPCGRNLLAMPDRVTKPWRILALSRAWHKYPRQINGRILVLLVSYRSQSILKRTPGLPAMDLAPHSSVFLLGNDERGVNVARRFLIVHNDFGYRFDLVQMFDLILVVCWPWAVVRRLDIWEGIAHFI